jgi:hypothetical protein
MSPPAGFERVVRGWTARAASRHQQSPDWLAVGLVLSFRCAGTAP